VPQEEDNVLPMDEVPDVEVTNYTLPPLPTATATATATVTATANTTSPRNNPSL
jgi:hypothetical protein